MCCACLHDAVVGPETYGHDGDNGPQHIPFKRMVVSFTLYTTAVNNIKRPNKPLNYK